MSSNHKISKGVILVLILLITILGCKSKKKAMEASMAAEKAKTEQAAALRKEQEEAARREAEEKARREAEANRNESDAKDSAPAASLTQYFAAIAGSSNVTSANNSINEALVMFASPDTPVLIVISESNGQKDYDRPTTIKNYLNYLKDQKKNINSVSNLKMDSSGKITEVELRKN